MTSNHLGINFVWMLLVHVATVAVRVWLKFEYTLSTRLSPAQNAFVASEKHVCLRCDNVFGGEMGSVCELVKNPPKQMKLGIKFLKVHFQ